jgi:hypothetical protein
MAWTCSGKTNVALVDNMFKAGLIKSPAVAAVSKRTPTGSRKDLSTSM